MTDLNLEELERICNAATPGEWDVDEGNLAVYSWPSDGDVVTIFLPDTSFANDPDVAPHNARFAAVAHSALPQLIAEVRRLQKECQDYESDREALTGILLEAEQLVPGIQDMQEYDPREAGRCIAHNLIAVAQEQAEKKARVLAEVIQGNVYKATSCEYCPIYTKDQLKYCLDSECGKCSEYILQWAEAKAKESTCES